jgi:hypothetical protein
MDDSNTTDPREQNASSRNGAEAKGGVTPQPGDPTDPKAAARRAEERDNALEEGGFGDHQGARI